MTETTPSKKQIGLPLAWCIHQPGDQAMDEWHREFAHRLRVTRIALNITEEEAAAAAGRSVKTWRRYEATGTGHITCAILLFAEHYTIDLEWLFGRKSTGHKSMPGKIAILPISRRQAVQS